MNQSLAARRKCNSPKTRRTLCPSASPAYRRAESNGPPNAEALELRALLSAYTSSVLENFGVSPNGANPTSTLVADSNGNLFGTTTRGGSQNAGTVFEIAKGTSKISTLVSFDDVNEFNPEGAIALDSSGNLYGTTTGGGPASEGAVYEVSNGSKSVTTLAFFNGQSGSSPNGLTIDAAGNLYGTTTSGTIFEVAAGTKAITTVATLNGTDGSYPQSTVGFDAAGNLYGTAADGGAHSDGTVFEIPKGSSTVTALASFSGANGQHPNTTALLVLSYGPQSRAFGGLIPELMVANYRSDVLDV